ncbi:hypothetical protein HME9302_01944 [Alteripontixanthobacter maritimus]|uniref:DUF2834 domain-containing protein n=1 Tax=Alteripontixanthobacter maritimus TaxID=2161824 RepID=A0A369QEL0_9SPHN|nr:hypothetical protein [Alteripontixanthobacter maritimus]RDC60728.1 hypothetical protein HME9302_01944 [Alteripontixanthobacter maritimus]
MRGFAFFCLVLWAMLAAYTSITIANHGLGLLPIFFGDIAEMGWPGQFNFDFFLMLILSAGWTAWRNRNGGTARWVLTFFAMFGGAGFLLVYLPYLIYKNNGDMAIVLLGPEYPGDPNP